MTWLITCLILLLMLGFAKLSTVIVNWLVAMRQPKWLIAVTELVQFSLIPIFLLLLVNDARNGGLQQLIESPISISSHVLTSTLVAIGALGFALLIRSTLAYQLYSPPPCQIASQSMIVDFRQSIDIQSWREKLVGPGPMRGIALLPGNEQFSVDVSTKTFTLPRLPHEWDGLSLVHLTDTHFRGAVSRRYFEAVCEQALALKPDLFVFTGDLLDDLSLRDWIPETFGRLKAPLGQYFILGNHDWYLDAPAIRKVLEQYDWTDLSGRSSELRPLTNGPAIVIAGDETPWMGNHPDLATALEDTFRILLSHTPDNINWAREQKVDLMLSGHTHGGQIKLPLLGPVYSPSRYGCRFASGVFWLKPTLLYVSRGLSGREPIRYQCMPELTKLVLRRS